MTFTAPASYGVLEGTLQGLGYCDADPAPLFDGTVQIESGSGMTWTLKTDETGHYKLCWMWPTAR
jgi:hypothetical protein